VVAGGHLAQRPVDLGRQQDDQEGRAQGEMAGGHPEAGLDGDQADRQGADQVEGGRGEEGHPEHPQGGPPVPVRHLGHHRHLPVRAAVHPQRRQPAYDVEEVPGQPGVGRPPL